MCPLNLLSHGHISPSQYSVYSYICTSSICIKLKFIASHCVQMYSLKNHSSSTLKQKQVQSLSVDNILSFCK